ncbi:MAG: DUF1638 domain-containing protein [Chloroflexi bacterium]|nr:DUF1638 domain-containing protein [Chloroflexota bacterium]
MPNEKTKIIACAVVIEELRSKLPAEVECEILDFGLHGTPQVLKTKLQESIDRSQDFGTIVLAYGTCGMAVMGLCSESTILVIPKADDCITLLLGSREAYLKQQRDNPGSLFTSKGWIEGRIDEGTQSMTRNMKNYQRLVERHGEERARRIQAVYEEKFRLHNYKRLAFITTNSETNLDEYKAQARERAAKLNLRYEEIPGSTALMDRIANGLWNNEFVVIPPGHTVTFEDFWPSDSDSN